MLKQFFILMLAGFFTSCGPKLVELSEAEKEELKADTTMVFDVRSAEEYETGNLEGSINVPHTELAEKIAIYVKSKDAKVVLYCGSGKRAGKAKKELDAMGYTDVTNAGGYKDLIKE